MAYEVTATRRRPQRFEDMIGQEFVVATLQKSIVAGKIAHAYLFSGPRGCGKTSSARILAKSLNCEKGPSGTPCGVCPACLEITRGSSLDVIEIDGASNTSVNDVRQIKDEVLFPPNSCRYKVYIIDEVHMLSTSAFNALLKTIEEPPPYVIFIFATTELHKVPATIKSRCQQFNFRLVPVEQLKAVLGAAAEESGIKADDEALFWVAREATGSVRDAYTLFDQVAAFSDGHITFEKIRDKLALVGVDRFNPIAEACVNRDGQKALSLLDDILQSGVSVEQFTADMADYLRNLLLLKNGITKESLLGLSPGRFSAAVLAAWSSVQIERAFGLMLQLYRDIRYSLEPRYELELAISRISWISDYVSPIEMKAAIVQARALLQKGAGGQVPAARHPPASPEGGSGPFNPASLSSQKGEAARAGEVVDHAEERGRADERVPEPTLDEQDACLESGNSPENAGFPHLEENPEFIANPFAALKERMGIPSACPVEALPPDQPREPEQTIPPQSVSRPSPVSASPQPSSPSEKNLPFEGLQSRLVEVFQTSKNMVATSLSQSFDWKDLGSTVSFAVDKPFVHNFLEQDHRLIAETVSSLLGRSVSVEIRLDSARNGAEDKKDGPPTIPEQVEMVRQMFRGTILGEG